MPRLSKAALAEMAEIEAEFAAAREGKTPSLPPELERMFAKAAREGATVRAGGGVFTCQHCYGEFYAAKEERFCSKRCRLRANAKAAEAVFSTEPETPEAELEAMLEPIFDPRTGRYRTTSWAKFGLPD